MNKVTGKKRNSGQVGKKVTGKKVTVHKRATGKEICSYNARQGASISASITHFLQPQQKYLNLLNWEQIACNPQAELKSIHVFYSINLANLFSCYFFYFSIVTFFLLLLLLFFLLLFFLLPHCYFLSCYFFSCYFFSVTFSPVTFFPTITKSLSSEWRCSWSSADRRCSNYIWVINNFIAYQGTTYVRGFTVLLQSQL